MSFRGWIVRFLLGMIGALAVGTLVVGRTGIRPQGQALAAGQASGSWASPGELAWLQRAGAWETSLMRRIVLRPREAVRECGSTLATQVGAAPTARLRRARSAFRRACVHLVRNEIRGGSQALVEANQLLPPGEARDLPMIAGASGLSRVEPLFGRVVSMLAGKDVEVRCWSRRDWPNLMREEATYTGGQLGPQTLGFAAIGGNRVNLAPAVCAGLAALAYDQPKGKSSRYMLAAAVVTLSHEPQHSNGISREAEAECNALQVAQRAAISLGATRTYAATLVRTYWTRYGEELPEYRSPQCRKGGALDLGYADSIWP